MNRRFQSDTLRGSTHGAKRGFRNARGSILRLLLAFFSLAIILAVLGGAAWLWKQANTPELIVPDQVGLAIAIARTNLMKMGLGVEILDEPGPDTMVGQVVRMAPGAGSTVKPGRSIILYVGASGGEITIPDLVGTYLIEVENRLARAGIEQGLSEGLIIGGRSSVASDSPAGLILSQSPAAGTIVKPGTAVSLVISVEKNGGRMPNLVGRRLEEAMDTMAARGYAITTVAPYFTTSQVANTIMSQVPAPGTPLSPAITVKVVVATPPASRVAGPTESTELSVPDDEPTGRDVNAIPDAEAPPAPAPRPVATPRPAVAPRPAPSPRPTASPAQP